MQLPRALMAAVSVLCVVPLCAPPVKAAPAPKTIGFMGVLRDPSGKPKSGDFSATLALYDVDAGGSPLWSEPQTVHATNGLFSTALGKVTPFPTSLDFAQAYFVGITLDGDAEMQPRIPLQGVPYALLALDVPNDASLLQKVSGGAMSSDGFNIGIGTAAPAAALDITRNVSGGRGPVLRLTGGGGTGTEVALDLATYPPDPGAEPAARISATDLDFSSHLDFKTKIPGAMTNQMLARMRITSDGKVGVNTVSPLNTLDIHGTLGVRNGIIQKGGSAAIFTTSDLGLYAAAPGWMRFVSSGSPIQFFTNFSAGTATNPPADSTAMTITAIGDVGIGTTNPVAKLDVRGAIAMDGGSTRAAGSLENLRIVRGTVNSNGTPYAGSGFTSTRLGEGQYQIDFQPAFLAGPTVIATALTDTGNRPYVVTMKNTWTGASVTLFTSDIQADFAAGRNGNFNDRPFNFIAIGPR